VTFVLDASVTMSWCFEDEASAATDALLHRLENEHALVPMLWEFEVANVLVVAQRRGRITAAGSSRFTSLLHALPIDLERPGGLSDLVNTGSRYSLSAYDAAYLVLAERTGNPLATRDSALKAAAEDAGVELLPT
jgi:predicted nucleic acid-binding protein